MFSPEFIESFWSRVDRSGGPDTCWPWLGGKTGDSQKLYGTVWIPTEIGRKRTRRAHVVAFTIEHNHWPEHQVNHSCDFPLCCNPSHLYDGPQSKNMADMIKRERRDHHKAITTLRLAGFDFKARARLAGLARRKQPSARPV